MSDIMGRGALDALGVSYGNHSSVVKAQGTQKHFNLAGSASDSIDLAHDLYYSYAAICCHGAFLRSGHPVPAGRQELVSNRCKDCQGGLGAMDGEPDHSCLG